MAIANFSIRTNLNSELLKKINPEQNHLKINMNFLKNTSCSVL